MHGGVDVRSCLQPCRSASISWSSEHVWLEKIDNHHIKRNLVASIKSRRKKKLMMRTQQLSHFLRLLDSITYSYLSSHSLPTIISLFSTRPSFRSRVQSVDLPFRQPFRVPCIPWHVRASLFGPASKVFGWSTSRNRSRRQKVKVKIKSKSKRSRRK